MSATVVAFAHILYLAAYFRKRAVICACKEPVESHDETLRKHIDT